LLRTTCPTPCCAKLNNTPRKTTTIFRRSPATSGLPTRAPPDGATPLTSTREHCRRRRRRWSSCTIVPPSPPSSSRTWRPRSWAPPVSRRPLPLPSRPREVPERPAEEGSVRG
uniref:Uncharacterized protein n=2 Tax=Aegilops tauschii subsp. strangulata TaxID=200361 RepID=A0A452XFX0_AEGTS